MGGDLKTRNGDIEILQGSRVVGDVSLGEPERGFFDKKHPKLIIDADSSVLGTIHLYREVELHIDDAASVGKILEHF